LSGAAHEASGAAASRSPGGGRVRPSTKRLIPHCLCNYRLAERPSPPGASHHTELLE